MQLKLYERRAALDQRLNLVQANVGRVILIKRSPLAQRSEENEADALANSPRINVVLGTHVLNTTHRSSRRSPTKFPACIS